MINHQLRHAVELLHPGVVHGAVEQLVLDLDVQGFAVLLDHEVLGIAVRAGGVLHVLAALDRATGDRICLDYEGTIAFPEHLPVGAIGIGLHHGKEGLSHLVFASPDDLLRAVEDGVGERACRLRGTTCGRDNLLPADRKPATGPGDRSIVLALEPFQRDVKLVGLGPAVDRVGIEQPCFDQPVPIDLEHLIHLRRYRIEVRSLALRLSLTKDLRSFGIGHARAAVRHGRRRFVPGLPCLDGSVIAVDLFLALGCDDSVSLRRMLCVQIGIKVFERKPAGGQLLGDHLNVVLLKLAHVLGKLTLHTLFCVVGAEVDRDGRHALDGGDRLLDLLHLEELVAELAPQGTEGPRPGAGIVVKVVAVGAGLPGEGRPLLPG